MPHYILVSFEDDKFPSVSQAHEHVVHALHGHGRALGKKAHHRDAFPVWQEPAQELDPEKLRAPYTLSEGEVLHFVAPPGYQLVFHQYHADGMTEHHTEVSIMSNEDIEKQTGVPPVAAAGVFRPSEVPDEIEDSWPQHEPITEGKAAQ